MTSSPHGLYAQGCKRATMTGTNRRKTARSSKSEKTGPSSDWSLQLDSMKVESLVIVDHLCYGECVPEHCTHRPSSHGSREYPKSLRFRSAEGKFGNWD